MGAVDDPGGRAQRALLMLTSLYAKDSGTDEGPR